MKHVIVEVLDEYNLSEAFITFTRKQTAMNELIVSQSSPKSKAPSYL